MKRRTALTWTINAAFVLIAGIARGADDFTTVRATLEARCVRCHNDQTAKGRLSLTTRAAILKGGDGGPAIEVGKAADSALVDMITGEKPLMPKQGEPLSDAEVAAICRWIDAGAIWPDGVVLAAKAEEHGPWWAIQPIQRPASPMVAKNADWPRNSIDAFVLAKLDANGLHPSPEADRRTLIRRLSFDMLGLPPTAEEVEAYERDTRPDAYERLVDRLLASPHYGERWARHWLDIVHYGDTHGYDKDKRRDHAWPYRDYVIRSLNDDKPYARFVREQIAGDQLWPDDPDATIATGFIAAGPWDFVGHVELAEDTVEKLKTRNIDRDDMVANTMSTFTSLTVHCARCHDHKFDPIPQRDYYRLQAVFAGVERGDRNFESATIAHRRAALVSESEEIKRDLEAIAAALRDKHDSALEAIEAERAALRKQLAAADGDAGGSPSNGYHSAIHEKPDAIAWVQVDLGSAQSIGSVRLIPARPTDFPDTPGFGFPQHFTVELSDDAEFQNARVIHAVQRPDDANQPDEALTIDANHAIARFVRVHATRLWRRTNDYVFALAELEVLSDGVNVARGASVSALDSIEAGRWSTRYLVDGYSSRAALEGTNGQSARESLAKRLNLLNLRFAERADQLTELPTRVRTLALQSRDAELAESLAALPAPNQVYATIPHAPRSVYLLNRGEVEQPGDLLRPAALSLIPNLDADFSFAETEGARRDALAEWIVDQRNMFTWRSIVNRVWQFHFGRGLVDTPNDFGRNGSAPTHPELLDWLATEFIDSGGSFKHLHRLILTSAAYRQASAHDPGAAAQDGENRLLWRQNRRRLEAEEIRDAILATSGTLNRRMYGPGFEVFRFKDDHSPIYDHEDRAAAVRPEGFRRAVYRFVVRSVPNPWIDCMDGADPNANVPVRNATITALQSLALLNDPFIIDQAERFAAQVRIQTDEPRSQSIIALTRALGRAPTADEAALVQSLIESRGLPTACRMLFNLNEFVFVD